MIASMSLLPDAAVNSICRENAVPANTLLNDSVIVVVSRFVTELSDPGFSADHVTPAAEVCFGNVTGPVRPESTVDPARITDDLLRRTGMNSPGCVNLNGAPLVDTVESMPARSICSRCENESEARSIASGITRP